MCLVCYQELFFYEYAALVPAIKHCQVGLSHDGHLNVAEDSEEMKSLHVLFTIYIILNLMIILACLYNQIRYSQK